jgi:predicted Ser/Thr protein kinase
MEVLAKGKRGITYLERRDGRDLVVKRKHPDSDALGTISTEARFLRLLNDYDIGPELIAVEEDAVVMEYIDGATLHEYIAGHELDAVRAMLRSVFDQLRTMDELGVNKGEMHHPHKHVIVDDEPVLIDFERCRKTETPQNVTQFCQFMLNTADVLHEKGFKYDEEDVICVAQRYKDSYSDAAYQEILEVFDLEF